MPTLINYSGNDELFRGATYANLMDSSILSLSSCMDVYYPPLKRSRVSAPAPFVFAEEEVVQKKQQQQQPSIEVLPDECLFEIFRRLPRSEEKSLCACVSKRWLMLLSSIRTAETVKVVSKKVIEGEVESDGYLSRCLKGKKATDNRLAAIAVGSAGCGGLGKLLIRGNNTVSGVSNVGLASIARGCPDLRVLSVWGISTIGDEGVAEIANGCHKLETLDLSECPLITDRALYAIAENCHNLTSLTIESCPRIGNDGLQAIARGCPKLHSITIKDCPLVGDQGISSLVTSSSETLTKVKLQNVNITEVSLAILGHYGRSITDLVLTGLQNVSERGFWVMGNAKGLQKLISFAITSCRGVTDVAIEAVAKGCPNLKSLFLHKCSFVSDNGLVAFTKNSTCIKSLRLEECNRISQYGVLAAISNCGSNLKALSLVKCMGIKDIVSEAHLLTPCKSLQSLSIRDCPGFGSVSLAVVGWLCPQLKNIDLSGLCEVTDTGFLSVVENCEAGLVKVNLNGCINITDASVTSLARLHGESLQVLNLSDCSKVTDDSLGSIAVNCGILKELDVSKCAITDLAVASLSCAKGLPLQILSLAGCSNISDRSLPYLADMGETLIGLNLQLCKSLSSNMIDLLVECLWRCDILA